MKQHPDAKEQLDAWLVVMKNNSFQHLPDLHRMFPTADLVGERKELICINIKGNHYRLIMRITFPKTVFVYEFLTHKEYDKKYHY